MRDNANVISDDKTHLLDDLHSLLEKQLDFARRGNMVAVERLSEQTEMCVRLIAEPHVLDAPGFQDGRQRIERLFGRLCLALKAQRVETSTALSAVRRGRRMLETYGNRAQSR